MRVGGINNERFLFFLYCPLQVNGFNYVLSSMFPTQVINTLATVHGDHTYMAKATKLREAAKKTSEQVKAQAEQIYQSYSAKN